MARRRAHDFGNVDLVSDAQELVSTQASAADVAAPSASHRRSLDQKPRGFFADQFENESNFTAHYEGTGPEIVRQTDGRYDAFVSGAGTGGTISGTGRALKEANKNVKVVLADPEGSGLFNRVKYGVMFAPQESEGTKRRHQVDTIVEGIGINRVTRNFKAGERLIDDAYR